MFQETNDAVAGVEVAALGGVELTEAGLRQALDAHLSSAVRGKVEPGAEAEAVAQLRDKFDLVLGAGVATLVSRDGQDVAAVIAAALASPSGPGAEAYAHWHAQMQKQKQWQQERPDYVARGLTLPRA